MHQPVPLPFNFEAGIFRWLLFRRNIKVSRKHLSPFLPRFAIMNTPEMKKHVAPTRSTARRINTNGNFTFSTRDAPPFRNGYMYKSFNTAKQVFIILMNKTRCLCILHGTDAHEPTQWLHLCSCSNISRAIGFYTICFS